MVIPVLIAATVAMARTSSVSSADLVETSDISSLAASPDGRYVAFRTERPSVGDNRYHLTWYVVPLDGSTPARALADGGDVEINSGVVVSQRPIWAPSSRAFFFRAAIDGQVQVWRAPVDDRSARRITNSPSDVRSLSLSADGRSLRFEVGATRDEVEDAEQDIVDHGVLIDGTVDVASALSHNDDVAGHAATMRFGGQWFDRQPLLWQNAVQIRQLDLGRDDVTTGQGAASPVALRVRIEGSGDRQQIHAIDSAGVDHGCSAPACPTDHIRTAIGLRNGIDVLVTTRDGMAAHQLSLWTPGTGRWQELTHSIGTLDGGHVIDDYPCAVGIGAIACIAADASGPPRLVGIDTTSRRVWPLFDPNAALRARELPARDVAWQTTAGVDMAGKLFVPSSPKPAGGYPLVIDYYSCDGFIKGGLGDELPMVPLAEGGVATLCINRARGSDKTHQWQEDTAVDAISTVITKLARDGLVDVHRIGMAGLSFGSEMVMTVLERTHLIRAAAISSLQIEPYYYWINRLPGRDITPTLTSYFTIGDPESDPTGWMKNAPIARIGAIRAPLLMQLPESEMRQTMELYSRLARSPTPVEMFAYPNETHIKWQPRHKLAVYERNFDWFRYWLLGVVDPDPVKADQYRRWHAFSSRPGFTLPVNDHSTP